MLAIALESIVHCMSGRSAAWWRACLGHGPTDSNSSIPYFGFTVFSVIWGIRFSLTANPHVMKTSDSGTVLARRTRMLLAQCLLGSLLSLCRDFSLLS